MKGIVTLGLAAMLAIAQNAGAQAKSSDNNSKSNSGVEQQLQQKEQTLWQAWKDKDMKPFHEMVTDDSVNVSGDGIEHGLGNFESAMKSCNVTSFNLSDYKTTWLDKNTALLTYSATQDGTCGGNKLPPKVNASSIWMKKNGKWVSGFHQESAATSQSSSSSM
jgi:hypothetical protein